MAQVTEHGLPHRGAGSHTVGETRTLWQEIVRARMAYFLLAPIFLSFAVFVYYPPLSALYHAFFDWDPTSTTTFSGLANFQRMAHDPILLNSLGNMVQLLVFGLVVGTTVPLIVAELMFAVGHAGARYAYRVLFLLPIVAPGIVTILLWQFIYDPNVGLLNPMLAAVGLGGLQHAWLGDPHTALYAMMFIGFPFVSGTAVLIYLAGLMNIPNEIIEAASLDGATGLQRIRRVDIPLLLGQIKLFIVLGMINGVQGFETQYVLTQGGPGWATEVPGLRMYQAAFNDSRFGYASAIGLVLFLVVLGVTILNFRFMRSSTEFEGRA